MAWRSAPTGAVSPPPWATRSSSGTRRRSPPSLRTIREAADLVEFLFGQHLPTSEVLDRIRDNPALDPEVRRRALDLVGPYGERLVDHEAERVVNALYETLLRPAVRARLLADKTLSEPVRRRALTLAEQIPESASCLNAASWSIVSQPGARSGGVSPGLGAGRGRLPT